jgi:recombination protein RecA
VAVLLPDGVRARVAATAAELREGAAAISWVRPENLHLTLRFLGVVDEAGLARVREALEEAAAWTAPFAVRLGGLGGFPSPRAPRVVWVGVEAGAEALAMLHARVESALAARGIPRETRPFHAHVTLGRARDPRGAPGLAGALAGGAAGLGEVGVDARRARGRALTRSGPVRRMAATSNHLRVQAEGREIMADAKAESKADRDRRQALELALSQIERQFGKGAVMKLGSSSALEEAAVIPTGCLSLDVALGTGGIPRGRVTEIFGPESSGKTTLALHVIAESQKQGGYAAFVDAEHALDAQYAKALGVNIDELLISQPDTGEQALEITEHLVRSGAIDVVVIDSVAALVPKAELEGEMGDSLPGLQARLMSQALRKLTAAISRSRTAVIFINQIREKIGVMFGSPETTPGGRALKFYASVRLDIRRMDTLKVGTESVGARTKVKVVKNKLAPPFREAEFDMMYGEGISREGNVLDLAVDRGIVEKSGTWFSYRDQRIGQGRDNARKFLRENAKILAEIEVAVRQAVGLKPAGEGT